MRWGVLFLCGLTVGCATERFGRAVPLTDFERSRYSCADIDLEMAKNEAFMKQITEERADVDGNSVLGFLGDFGIGNSMEYEAAMKSAQDRQADLRMLHATKVCSMPST